MLTPPLLKEAAEYLTAQDLQDVRDAYERAKELYRDKRYSSGEPLLIHAEKVARLLLHLHPDTRTIVTALLQYVKEKDALKDIEQRFGKRVIRTISSLAVLEQGSKKSTLYSAGYLRKMALALSEDIRVLLIWLHTCWHLLQEESMDEKEQRTLAREVLDVFAPIAARLGMYSLKYTLENLAFAILYPSEAAEIEEGLRKLRKQEGSFLADSARSLKRLLAQEGKHVEVIAREKHPFSIFRKVQEKSVSSMRDLHDLFGLRILVDSVEECYQILGAIHRTYRPILHRVKDYIAFPKPNGYRSIHTTILGLNVRDPSLPVEIQIRTQEMNESAEYGIAAHWNYKEGEKEDPSQHHIWQDRMQALRKLSAASGENEEALNDLLSDRIYVLTPKGDPIELPKGATPLDFAFRVHTDVGLCFRTAKVNGSIAPIDRPLENGDMVEITKQKTPHPSAQWLQIVRTHEARNKLRSFFRIDHPFTLLPDVRVVEQKHWREERTKKRTSPSASKTESLITLESDIALPHRFAKCCTPHRPEGTGAGLSPIVGFITRGGSVNIHRKNCRMLSDANPERMIRAHWKKSMMTEKPRAKNAPKRKLTAA